MTAGRTLLLLFLTASGALLFGGLVAFLGMSFSAAVEPDSFSIGTVAFWLGVGIAITAGYWLVPLVLSRQPLLSAGAKAAVFIFQVPICLLAGSVVAHNLAGFWKSGSFPSVGAFAICLAALVISICILVFVLLVKAKASES